MNSADNNSGKVFSSIGLRISFGFGFYFAWVSIIHYIYVFGGTTLDLGTPIAAAVSLASVLFYGWVFLRYTNGKTLAFSRIQNYLICAVAVLGTLCISVPLLQYFVPLLISLPIAWFRLAYAEYFAEVGGRATLLLVGVAFAVCGGLLIITTQLMGISILIVEVLTPVACVLLLNSIGEAKPKKTETRRYNTSPRDYWRLAGLALILSLFFDVTETHLVFGSESLFAIGLPAGFLLIALCAVVMGALIRTRSELGERALFISIMCCALLGSASFFLRPLIENVAALMAIQTLGGYGFVALLLVASATIAKQKNMQAGLVFAIVLCCQRIGNSLGEVVGSAIISILGSSSAAYFAISLLTICVLILIPFLFLFKVRNSWFDRFDQIQKANDSVPEAEDPTTQALIRVALQHGLTQREIEVFLLAVDNRLMKEIEEELCISKNTLKTHLQRIYQKFGVHSRQELILDLKKQMD